MSKFCAKSHLLFTNRRVYQIKHFGQKMLHSQCVSPESQLPMNDVIDVTNLMKDTVQTN